MTLLTAIYIAVFLAGAAVLSIYFGGSEAGAGNHAEAWDTAALVGLALLVVSGSGLLYAGLSSLPFLAASVEWL